MGLLIHLNYFRKKEIIVRLSPPPLPSHLLPSIFQPRPKASFSQMLRNCLINLSIQWGEPARLNSSTAASMLKAAPCCHPCQTCEPPCWYLPNPNLFPLDVSPVDPIWFDSTCYCLKPMDFFRFIELLVWSLKPGGVFWLWTMHSRTAPNCRYASSTPLLLNLDVNWMSCII
jgi:hypothetical protein